MSRIQRQTVVLLALSLGALEARLSGAQERTDEAVKLFEARQFGQARPLLEATLRENPSDARAAFYLGRLLLSSEEPGGAVQWIEKAAVLDPERAEYHLWLARAYGAQALRANVFHQPALARKVRREF